MSILKSLFGREPIVGSPKDTNLPPHTFPELSGVDRGEARYHLAGYTYKKRARTSSAWFIVGFFVFLGVTAAMTMSGDTGSYASMMCINPFVGFIVSIPFFVMTGVRGSSGR
jgi:hypothetical protein